MRYFPAFLDLEGQSCLIVGGGETAARKLRLLRKAGAEVTLVAPTVTDEIAALDETRDVTWQRRRFRPADVRGKAVVLAATGIDAIDARVSEVARAADLPTNVVDRPELSSFIMPAIVDRDPVVIGISSGGAAPVLARRIRARIEGLLPSRLGGLARFAESFRPAVGAKIAPSERRGFWERVFDGAIAKRYLAGDEAGAAEAMLKAVNRPGAPEAAPEPGLVSPGIVSIVGAGPGDPDLLTLKALRAIQDADVIVYDRLVGDEILDYARRDAERIYVGKAKANHSKSQDEINAILAAQAAAGHRVVRLKGGDPFIFGRGGEEVAYLRAREIAVELVPGITAATAAGAAAGIPLTHRGLSQALTIVTGHAADGEPDLDWDALADPRQTLAIYMGVSTAATTAEHLIAHGAEASRPVAVIENATRPEQRTVTATLGDLAATVAREGLKGPAIIVIGAVAAFAQSDNHSDSHDRPLEAAPNPNLPLEAALA